MENKLYQHLLETELEGIDFAFLPKILGRASSAKFGG